MHPCCAALLSSQLSRPAAALLDEAACLLAANDTAALLTRRSACASFNATLSATDGIALMCPAACRRKLQQVCSMAYPKEEDLTEQGGLQHSPPLGDMSHLWNGCGT